MGSCTRPPLETAGPREGAWARAQPPPASPRAPVAGLALGLSPAFPAIVQSRVGSGSCDPQAGLAVLGRGPGAWGHTSWLRGWLASSGPGRWPGQRSQDSSGVTLAPGCVLGLGRSLPHAPSLPRKGRRAPFTGHTWCQWEGHCPSAGPWWGLTGSGYPWWGPWDPGPGEGAGAAGEGQRLGRLCPNPSSTRHQAASGGLSSLLGAVGPSGNLLQPRSPA